MRVTCRTTWDSIGTIWNLNPNLATCAKFDNITGVGCSQSRMVIVHSERAHCGFTSNHNALIVCGRCSRAIPLKLHQMIDSGWFIQRTRLDVKENLAGYHVVATDWNTQSFISLIKAHSAIYIGMHRSPVGSRLNLGTLPPLLVTKGNTVCMKLKLMSNQVITLVT